MAVIELPDGVSNWWQATIAYIRSPFFIVTFLAHVVAMAIMIGTGVDLQWFWLLLYSWLTIPFSPWVFDAVRYLRGGLNEDQGGSSSFGFLACSTFVAWVFAKSIYNASTLGAKYGITGGLAYAAYYTSFPAAAICIYFMRVRFGYRSLPEAINQRYGPCATVVFGMAVLYRLYQEVWSNSLVVGSFFGPTHSTEWWTAVCVSTAIPAIYSITGGMRSSLLTDVYQAAWKVCLLVIILSIIGSRKTDLPGNPMFGNFNPAGTCSLAALPQPPDTYAECAEVVGNALVQPGNTTLVDPVKATFTFTSPTCVPTFPVTLNQTTCQLVGATWTQPQCKPTTEPACDQAGGVWTPQDMTSLAGGIDLLIVGLLQGCLSYPFFDPVLTDRAFLAAPRTMLWAFMAGGALAATFIILFSFVGSYGAMAAILAPETVSSSIFANVKAGIPAAVAAFIGTGAFSLLNLVFIVSSCAVLDSTFASTAKLFGPEFSGLLTVGRPLPPTEARPVHTWIGRAMIIVIAVVGTVPLIQDPAALDATTVSGTMIMGLGPPVWALTFIKGYRPLVFHLPFWAGAALGIVFQLSTDKCCKNNINTSGFAFGQGSYNTLLGFNSIGAIVCWSLMVLALVENWQSLDLMSMAPFSLLGAAMHKLRQLLPCVSINVDRNSSDDLDKPPGALHSDKSVDAPGGVAGSRQPVTLNMVARPANSDVGSEEHSAPAAHL